MESASDLVVAAKGCIYVGPNGTPLPATADSAVNGAFIALGYVSEAGLKFTDTKSIKEHRAWQAFYPVRYTIDEKSATVGFELLQWDGGTIPLAFGGGSIIDLGGGQYEYEPPSPETIDLRTVVATWQDGTKNYALCIPTAMVTNNVETTFARAAPSLLPLTLSVVCADGAVPWTLLTDDPAFSEVS